MLKVHIDPVYCDLLLKMISCDFIIDLIEFILALCQIWFKFNNTADIRMIFLLTALSLFITGKDFIYDIEFQMKRRILKMLNVFIVPQIL